MCIGNLRTDHAQERRRNRVKNKILGASLIVTAASLCVYFVRLLQILEAA